ncbi:hypothetical protein VZC37_14170 [Gordonia sp. LSe1-13]|uniref:SalK n=1 Tax=Gordonia sesuvii TaxID=3116777 RepID=A0ABU7MEG3_9ACTN|nr:hypothetical protein [Gordonia sp. LSe1-13]
MTSPVGDADHQTARKAYEALEPFHVLAYFNRGHRAAEQDTGLDFRAFYVGARGAPMGDCDAALVTAAFYNFSPEVIVPAWTAAREVGLDRVARRRDQMLDEQLRAVLGDRIDDAEIRDLEKRYREIAVDLPMGGRPLAAGWGASAVPDVPHVALWHAIAIIREWRGDNHIAALVNHQLGGIDAVVFHEAELPDPTVQRRVLGRKLVQLTRGWSDEEWEASVDRLAARGVVERTDDGHRLTDAGATLYGAIEDETDLLSAPAWSGGGVDDLLARTRPYVKAVIDAGILPGTRKKD